MSAKNALAAVFAAALVALAPPAISRPTTAPDFTWDSSDGATVHLKDLHGHLVVVNFFATWCGPCREEMPDLVKVADDYAGRGVYVVGVDSGQESVDAVTAFANKYNIGYQLVVDSQNLIAGEYGVHAFPTTFIVGTNGSIIVHVVGPIAGSDLRTALDTLLARSR